MRWIHTQPLEHADRIELRCRLHQASEYHLLEHVVLNRPEAQARIRSSQRGPKHVAGGPHDANTAGTRCGGRARWRRSIRDERRLRSEEHTSELQSRGHLVCRLLLEKKKLHRTRTPSPSITRP